MKTSLSASAVAENQKATAPVDLTEAETDRVAGGDNGNHFGQLKNGDDGYHFGQTAKELGVPAWSLNPGHNK